MYFTEKQLRVLEFVRQFRAEHGFSPTMEEIAESFGVTKITIYGHVTQLERKGAVKREKFRARSILPLVNTEDARGRIVLPMLAGHGTEEEKTLDLSAVLPLTRPCFALRVQDDMLLEDGIKSGDYVIVERRSQVLRGDLVLWTYPDGPPEIKRFPKEKRRLRRGSSRPARKGRVAGEGIIQGVVVGLLRSLSPAERN